MLQIHLFIVRGLKMKMIKVSCIYCNKLFTTRKKDGNNYPYCCSWECIKKVENYDDLLILSRGYPRGYQSKDIYELALFNKEIIDKNCIICNSIFQQIRSGKGICSPECTKEKRKQTCIQKYGCDHPFKNVDIQNKRKQTFVDLYGCENPQQNKNIKLKTTKTCLKKYGSSTHLNSPYYIEKRKQICLEKFGVDNYFKRKDLVIESYQNKFGEGITHPNQVEEIQQKRLNTVKEKYVDLIGCFPRQKTEQTCLERYGNKSFFASEMGKMSFDNLKNNYGWTDEEIDELSKKKNDPMKFGNGISKESLTYFIPFYTLLLENGIDDNDIYFGYNDKKELHLSNNNIRGFYDFAIISWKVVIEYHGTAFHPNVNNLSTEELKNWKTPFHNNINWVIQLERDKQKQELAESCGYTYYVLWSSDSKETNENILNDIFKQHITYITESKQNND